MKNLSASLFLSFIFLHSFSQQTAYFRDPLQRFNEAKEYFQKEQYSLAYPIFRELQQTLTENDRINMPIEAQEIRYYATVSALKQNLDRAEHDANDFITIEKNNARVQMMSFHLAEYHFRKGRYADAAEMYEKASVANLSNPEIADMKFHQGYAYFTMQRFNEARPLLNAIRQMKDDPNYIDANYYYGFIAFRDRNYGDALQSFRIVEHEPSYSAIVPYYIAQIYYVQGRRDEALAYAEEKIRKGETQYYDLELKQLLGHGYFEKKQYEKAAVYLEDYVSRSKKVRREDLYELAYSNYQAGRYNNAIEGFRQLSGSEDSLSQHAMYLLGDSYLKTGQKANARNAFHFSAGNSSNPTQREISRFNYAKLSYELGFQDEALKGLRSFLNDYPGSVYREEATGLLVGALTNTNNYRDALALLEGIQNPTPGVKRLLPRILFGRATELINDGRLSEADALLTRAMNEPGNSSVLPLVNFWKGEIAYRNNDIDAAIRYYHAYLNSATPAAGEANVRNARYNLGYAYYRKENYAVARTFFEPLSANASLSSDPITQDAYVRTADVHYMNRNYSQARTMYDNVIRYSWPAEDYATYQKAMITGISNFTEKITLLNDLIRKFPASGLVVDANLEIANTYLALERFREAIPYLTTVAANTANSSLAPQAFLKLGVAYYNLNNRDQAISQYRTILNRFPNSPEADDALDNLRVILVEQGRPEQYADIAREAGKPLSVDAEDSLLFTSARMQYENGNFNAAFDALNNYLQRFENGSYSTNAHYYRAEIYLTRKDWSNALANYRVVADRAPNVFAERAVLQAARLNFFELKNYAEAEKYYAQLKQIAAGQETRLEAMRGLLRSQYQLQKWTEAVANSRDLIAQKGASTDDKALANMTIGKSAQIDGQYDVALSSFRQVIAVNKAALAAEARYEIANTWYMTGRMEDAEKAAFEVISKSGSYDWWVTKAYILLGDVYFSQKDYFNAKATFQSVVQNALNAQLKEEARQRLDKVIEEENRNSKLQGN